MATPTAQRPSPAGALVLWLACVGSAAVVALALSGDEPPAAGSTRPGAALERDALDRLDARLAALERRVAALDVPRGGARVRDDDAVEPLAAAVRAPDGSTGLAALESRLRALEAFEDERQRRLAEQRAEAERHREERRRRELAQRDVNHSIILDPARSDGDKGRAWRELRNVEDGAWPDEVLLEMTRIGAESADDRARELAWIGADGRNRSDLLVGPLLRALASDPVEDVREEAADALGHYLGHPGVRQALRHASLHDASSKVRQEALESLAR